MSDDTHGRILLAIDIQHGFINPHTRHIPQRVAQLIDQSNYLSAVATRFVNTARSPWVRLMHWHGMTTVGEQALHPLISERATRTFDKTTYSAATPTCSPCCATPIARAWTCAAWTRRRACSCRRHTVRTRHRRAGPHQPVRLKHGPIRASCGTDRTAQPHRSGSDHPLPNTIPNGKHDRRTPLMSKDPHTTIPITLTLPTADTNRILHAAVAYAAPRGTGMTYWVSDSVSRNATRITRHTRQQLTQLTDRTPGMYRDCWTRMRLDLTDATYRGDDHITFQSTAAADFTLAAAWRWEAEQANASDAPDYWTHLLTTPLAPILLIDNHRHCTLRDMRWNGLYDRPGWKRFRNRLEQEDEDTRS